MKFRPILLPFLNLSRKSGVTVVSLVNSDSNIKGIDYPIVANDSGIPSIKFFANAIIDAYKEGLSAQVGQSSVNTKQ